MKHLSFVLAIVLYTSCTEMKNSSMSSGDKKTSINFKLPIISQKPFTGSIVEFNEVKVNPTFMEVARKSQYCDTLKVSWDSYQDTTIWRDLNRRLSDSVLNSISFDGFEVKTDYSKCIYKEWLGPGILFPFYPVYIINATTEIKYFPGKDGYAFGIQEALDSNGIWRPIEGRGFDCLW